MTAGEVSINIYDHGVALDEKKQRVQCNYCGKVMSGFSRLKYHVGGIRGDVVPLPCEKVAVNVRESFRSMLLETKRASLDKEVQDPYHPDLPCKRFYSPDLNAAKRKKRDVNHTTGCGSGMHAEMHSVMEDDMTEHVSVNNRRTAMSSSGAKENVLSRQAQRCIGRFFYETGFDFSASTLPSFQRMINATLDDGQSEYKVPSLQDLKGWILHDEVEEMKTYVKEISRSWASTGCSVLLDGWVDEKGRNLVSFVVECPGGPTYLRSADVSAIIDDVNALQMLLEGVIEEVGIDNVVQIVASSTVGWVGAVGEQFMQRYWCVFWCVSASHCIELMLEKIGAMDSIRIALEKAKIITKFIYGHTEVLKLLRNHIDDYDLIKPSKMKLAMPFFTLENIVSEKKNLEEMFDSSEWKTSVWSSTVEGKRVADLVGDHSFWSGAEMASKAAVPLLCVLRLVNEGDKPQVGFIYETMDQVKETIKKEFKNKKSDYTPFWTAIDDIWDAHLHSPLHAAGYYLNPCLFYSPDFYSDPEVTFGLLCCLVRMVANQRTQLKITFQLDDYRHARGAFEEGKAIYKRTNVSPAQWWCTYGKQCPELQRFAVRILSQTCDGASRYGLKRSMAEKILTDRRNPIEQKRLRDMVFVHYNLQVQNKRFGSRSDVINEEIDPLDDWVVDEAPQEVVPENGDRGLMDSECSEDTTNVEGHRGFQAKEEPIEDKYNGLESDDLRDHLTVFAESLNKARAMIYPPTKKSSKLGEILPGLGEIVDKEHKILLARKSIIEKRKEEQERQLLEMEREEESRRLKQLKITEEAEHKRLAAEYEQRNRQRILREIEERELEEAQALLEEQEKCSKRRGKKPILEGEKVTKQILMERALSEQLRERQEMEKKFQKLAKTMDYLERAKREEAAPLIEAAFQQRLVEEKALHEHEQQLETELSRQRHDGDLKEKYRLSRMLENKIIFEERVKSRREAEFNQRKAEREERINQIIQARKQEREALRKKIFFVRSEEERLNKLREEEEARKLEEAERRRKEEAERKAKLDEIAEKQRQRERELEEKERVRREALLGRTTDGPLRPSELPAGPDPGAAAPAAAAPAPAKYVPRFRRGGTEGSAPAPPETDKWGGGSSRPAPPDSDKWSSGARQATADADRWGGGGRWGSGDSRPDDRNPPGDRWGGGSKSTWSEDTTNVEGHRGFL